MSFIFRPRESIADELKYTGGNSFCKYHRFQLFGPFVIWMVVKFLILIELSSVLVPPILSQQIDCLFNYSINLA